MKKILFLPLFGALLLTGCFETTEEIRLNEDGSGSLVTTNDLSSVIGLAKQMGGGGNMEKMGEQKIDTSWSLGLQADSIPGLSQAERDMLRKGTIHVKMNMKEDQFVTKLNFPFTSADEISAFNRLSAKVMGNVMKSQAGSAVPGGMNDMPEVSSFDDYYKLEAEKGELKRSLNKEKYAGVESDEYLKGMKEAAGMGLPVTSTYIISLPRPVSKVEGKNAVLSEDKMKVTIKADIDDFFDHPEKLEFKIKY